MINIIQSLRSALAVVQGIVCSYAEIFFLSRAAVGFVLVVGTLLNWRIGAAGLLAVVAAYAFARLIRMDARALQSGYYTYNPLLAGLSLGATLTWSWPTALLIVVAGVLTFLLTAAIVHLFRFYMETKTKTWPQISWVIPKQLVITKVIGKLDYTIDEGDRTDWIGFVRKGSDKRYTITIDKNIPHYRTISFGILPEIGDIVRFWYIEIFFSKEKFFNLAILY